METGINRYITRVKIYSCPCAVTRCSVCVILVLEDERKENKRHSL